MTSIMKECMKTNTAKSHCAIYLTYSSKCIKGKYEQKDATETLTVGVRSKARLSINS